MTIVGAMIVGDIGHYHEINLLQLYLLPASS